MHAISIGRFRSQHRCQNVHYYWYSASAKFHMNHDSSGLLTWVIRLLSSKSGREGGSPETQVQRRQVRKYRRVLLPAWNHNSCGASKRDKRTLRLPVILRLPANHRPNGHSGPSTTRQAVTIRSRPCTALNSPSHSQYIQQSR